MSQKKTIKGSGPVLEARRVLQGSKRFIILSDDGTGNVRLFTYGYDALGVMRTLARVHLGMALQKKGEIAKVEADPQPQALSQSPLVPFPEPSTAAHLCANCGQPVMNGEDAEHDCDMLPQFTAPHLYAPAEPPPAFAPDGRHESEAESDGG